MAIAKGSTKTWTKSSYSANGACVEVRSATSEAISVRDSKAVAGPRLGFAPSAWTGFVDALNGEALRTS